MPDLRECRPIRGRVVVEPEAPARGPLWTPDAMPSALVPQIGRVIAFGGPRREADVAGFVVGDRVMWLAAPSVMDVRRFDGLVFVAEEEIVAVLEPAPYVVTTEDAARAAAPTHRLRVLAEKLSTRGD